VSFVLFVVAFRVRIRNLFTTKATKITKGKWDRESVS